MNTLSSLLKFIGDTIGAAPSTLTTTSKTLVGAINEIDSDVSGLLDVFYPVGSYYETDNANFDPNTAWGGTWVQDSAGRVLVAYDSSIAAFDTINETGGSKDAVVPQHSHSYTYAKASTDGHTLTVDQIPSHSHAYEKFKAGATTWYGYGNGSSYIGNERVATDATGGGNSHSHNIGTRSGTTGQTGSSVTDANLQPYKVAYRWHRTA